MSFLGLAKKVHPLCPWTIHVASLFFVVECRVLFFFNIQAFTQTEVHFFFFFLVFLPFLGPLPWHMGCSQARGPIRAVAATYTTAHSNAGSLTH